jgi:hypothetical protein
MSLLVLLVLSGLLWSAYLASRSDPRVDPMWTPSQRGCDGGAGDVVNEVLAGARVRCLSTIRRMLLHSLHACRAHVRVHAGLHLGQEQKCQVKHARRRLAL